MGFGYKPFVLGRSTQDTVSITVETPPFEIEKVGEDTCYMRYEDADVAQLINRIQEVGGVVQYTYAYHLWSDKENGDYKAYIVRT